MFKKIDGAFRVALADLYYLKRNFLTVLITVLVLPMLYFVSFAYGLGSTVDETEGVTYIAFVIPGIISLSTLSSCFSTTANKGVIFNRMSKNTFQKTEGPGIPDGRCATWLCTEGGCQPRQQASWSGTSR